MAITVVRASSQYLEATGAPLGATANGSIGTMACWYAPSSIANGTAFGIGSTNQSNFYYMALGMDATGRAFFEGRNGTDAVGATLSVGTWAHLAGTFNGLTNRQVYVNGAAGAADTANAGVLASIDTVTIGGLQLGSLGRVSFAGGDIAECAIWNVALAQSEITMLALGVSPRLVRPSALVFYSPLRFGTSPEQDLKAALAITFAAGGAAPTRAPHPRILSSSPPRWRMTTTVSSSFSQSASDSFLTTDAVARSVALPRVVSDALAVTDAANRGFLALPRASSDSIAMTDAVGRVKTAPRSTADSIAVTDAPIRTVARPRATSDSVALSDTSSKVSAYPRSTSDSVSVSDSLGRVVALARALTASIAMSDVVGRVLSLPRALADAFSISDTTGTSGSGSQAGADTVAVSDSLTRTTSRSRLGANLFTISDVLSRGPLILPRSAADVVVIGDAVARVASFPRARAVSVVVSDAVQATRSINRFTIDSITVGSGASRSVVSARVGGEMIMLTDLLTKVVHVSQFAFDTININDVVVVPIELRKFYAKSYQGASIVGVGGRLRVGGAASQSSAISTIGTRT